MLPLRKQNDQSFLSVPVSRVSSSQRLNQLSPQTGTPNAYSSIPTTPIPYVSSSLNPTRNAPVASSATTSFKTLEDAEAFERLPIVEDLRKFEQQLAVLSSDITSYRDNDDRIQSTVQSLIELNNSLYSGIRQVEIHQKLGSKIKTLKEEKKHLDTTAKNTLKQLIEYRSKLKELPSLPTTKGTSSNKNGENNALVDIKEILKYAMKLSKFSKMPPSAIDLPQQVHPNNYIWPAEDALRRGMLAVSSLRADELIRAELNDDDDKSKEESEGVKAEPSQETESGDRASEAKYDRSKSSHHHSESKPKEEAKELDLDLFDPDEDDYSD